MTVIALDSFSRVVADLDTEARWQVDSSGVGSALFRADGQMCTNGVEAAPWDFQTKGVMRWTGYDTGVDYGQLSVKYRWHPGLDEMGFFVRSKLNASSWERLAAVYVRDSARWELRYYTAIDTWGTILVALDSLTGYSPVEEIRTMTLKYVPDACQTNPNTCAQPGSVIRITVIADGITIFGNWAWNDLFLTQPTPLEDWRGFGVEAKTAEEADPLIFPPPPFPGWAPSPILQLIPGAFPSDPPDQFYFDEIAIEDFRGASFEDEPTLVAEPSLTPITVQGETLSTAGTLPYTPDIGERVTRQFFTQTDVMMASYEVTWPRFQEGRYLFAIGHSALTDAERDTLITFLEDHNGSEQTFSYTDPSDTVRTVYFVTGSVEFKKYGPDNQSVSYVLEEAF